MHYFSVGSNLPSYIILGLGPRTRFRFFLDGTPLLSAASKKRNSQKLQRQYFMLLVEGYT